VYLSCVPLSWPSLFSVAEAGIDHKDILVELPVTLRNSRLVNSLLCELDVRDTKPDGFDFLGLSARCVCVCMCVPALCKVPSIVQSLEL